MAKYTINYACGHSDSVNLIGPHRYRESRIAYLENGECFECYKQHTTKASQEQAQALELPTLVGTEKQIAWSETLRIAKLTEIEEEVERLTESKQYRQILMAVEKISNETSAKQWIEWRHDNPTWIINDVLKKMLATPTDDQKRAEQEAREKADAIRRAALVEATIRPAKVVSELSAEIQINGNIVSVIFPEKNDDFRTIVKSMDYAWSNGCWQRTIGKLAGTPMERATELGHTLLSRGFVVRCFDEILRARIVAGTFEPEQTRWISKLVKGNYAGWLAIQWGHHEDYYDVARKIANSKYSRPFVVASPVQFEQVLDFAQMYDFCLSNGAQALIEQARIDKEQMLVVSKTPVARQETVVVSDKPPTLAVPSSVEIDDEFRESKN